MSKLPNKPKSKKIGEYLANPISKTLIKPLRKKITLTELREMFGYEGEPHA